MLLLYLLIAGVLLYGGLLVLIPKATNLHEVLRLPLYQLRMQMVPCNNMIITKHTFGSQRRQYLLHCRPKAGQAVQDKVIVYYHGGGWAFGTPEAFRANAQFYVNLGYEVFLPSYRRIPMYQYPEMREDISLAIQKIKTINESGPLPNRQIILGGMSAGANLVALILHDRATLAKLGIAQNWFAGMFLFGGPLDLSKMQDTLVLRAFAGSRDSDQFKAANPIQYLQAPESIPVLCVHGDQDGFVNYKSALSYYKKRESIQPNFTQLYPLKGGTHLDAGSWNFFDDHLRKKVISWLEELN